MNNAIEIRLRIPKPLAKRLRKVTQSRGESRDSLIIHAIQNSVAQHEYKELLLAWYKAEVERQKAEAKVVADAKRRMRRFKKQGLRRMKRRSTRKSHD